MRLKTSPAVLLVTTLIFVAAAPVAIAASTDDACTVLTQSQVSAAVGVAVGAGTHVTPTYKKTCTWTATDASSKGVRDVTFSFQEANSFQSAKSLMVMSEARMKATNAKGAKQFANQSAGGIGDDAFYTTMGEGYTGLLVKKGNVSFKIAIYGSLPQDKKEAAEKALALEAVSKLR